jgi:hypothetical protein
LYSRKKKADDSTSFSSVGNSPSIKTEFRCLAVKNRMTNILYREISKKLPLMVKVQTPLLLELRKMFEKNQNKKSP